MLHCFNHATIASKQQVVAPKVFTLSVSLPSGTATAWSVSPTAIPAAFGFTNCISIMFLLFGFFDVFLLIVFRFKIKSSLPAGFQVYSSIRSLTINWKLKAPCRTTLLNEFFDSCSKKVLLQRAFDFLRRYELTVVIGETSARFEG